MLIVHRNGELRVVIPSDVEALERAHPGAIEAYVRKFHVEHPEAATAAAAAFRVAQRLTAPAPTVETDEEKAARETAEADARAAKLLAELAPHMPAQDAAASGDEPPVAPAVEADTELED